MLCCTVLSLLKNQPRPLLDPGLGLQHTEPPGPDTDPTSTPPHAVLCCAVQMHAVHRAEPCVATAPGLLEAGVDACLDFLIPHLADARIANPDVRSMPVQTVWVLLQEEVGGWVDGCISGWVGWGRVGPCAAWVAGYGSPRMRGWECVGACSMEEWSEGEGSV